MSKKPYKGYQSERHYHNCKLHGLATVMVGEDHAKDFLKEEVCKIIGQRDIIPEDFESTLSKTNSSGLKQLTDPEARDLYYRLVKSAHKMKSNVKAAREITGTTGNEMSDKQRKMIISITKFRFKWSIPVTFSKITEYCPELLKRLTPWQIKNYKLGVVYNLMTNAQANTVIKRLTGIERRNKEKQKL